MNLSDLVKVYDNVLSKELCQEFINFFEIQKENSDLHDTEGYKFNQLDFLSIGRQDVCQFFAKEVLKPYSQKYFEETGFQKWVPNPKFESVRIKKYEKVSEYRFDEHVDVINEESCRRYLVGILYLNDNNGFTTFDNLDLQVKPKTGTLVVFPPLWMFPHSGLSPTDNEKYIMMSSLNY